MNETPKIVFSESADWPESRIARGELAQKIADLKRESDKDLIAWGGASFAQSLAREGLIDVYRLTTHPVAVANGEPLFKDLKAPARLKLVESKMFESATMNVSNRHEACAGSHAGGSRSIRPAGHRDESPSAFERAISRLCVRGRPRSREPLSSQVGCHPRTLAQENVINC